jgi:tRNA(Ile2)-agmatinylcytidine synthase
VKRLAIGLDGYDSNFSGCTTHFTIFLLKTLKFYEKNLKLLTDPLLVRLNPNIPFKTRGNAAVSLLIEGELSEADIEKTIEELSAIYSFENKGSAYILDLDGNRRLEETVKLYLRGLTDLVPQKVAEEVAEEVGGVSIGGKSLVGALAAIGYALSGLPSTFELLAYRAPEAEFIRRIDEKRVSEVLLSYRTLFNNVNRKNKVVAVPRGPDPVLIGIRGIDKGELEDAFRKILPYIEAPSSWCIFRTNQHTDPHAVHKKIGELRVYVSGLIEGYISRDPLVKKGGHVILNISDESGEIETIFYRETYPMNVVASKLKKGDRIRILGGALEAREREGLIFEAEKLWILSAPEIKVLKNPRCPRCNARMESAGKGKGYRCPKCGYRTKEALEKELFLLKRDLPKNPISPLEGRIRHLVKPPELEGIELPRIELERGEIFCRF